MDRERAKELLPVFEAYANGKTIQYFNISSKKWFGCEPIWSDGTKYRAKPERRYIPFDFSDANDIIGDVVVHKESGHIYLINGVSKDFVFLRDVNYSFEILFECFEYPDGTPCGKLQE